MAKLILLNGPSSSGKSTLSRAIKTKLGGFEVVSIDDFMKISTEETIYEDDVFEISGDLCEAVLDMIKTAHGVIIDHVITSERIYTQLREMLKGYPLFTVHVECPLEVLIAREEARHNRCIGSAEASYTYLYPKNGYDLAVNTHSMTSQECAERILEAI